jgi:hypothetical protein
MKAVYATGVSPAAGRHVILEQFPALSVPEKVNEKDLP